MYIRTFESFEIDKYVNCKFYRVSYWKDNSYIQIEYEDVDYEYVKSEFGAFDTNDLDYDIKGEYNRFDNIYNILVSFEEKINKYRWVGDADDDIKDYPISEYYDDNLYYELFEEGEYVEVDSKYVETPESVSNREEKKLEEEIESEVISYIKSITSESKYAAFLGSTFYALMNYKDGYIMFRVSDHFFNISNVQLGKDVLYDYLEGLPQYNTYKNIYGFISINILNKNSHDKKGFRKDFIDWKDDNPKLKYLVDYIDLEVYKSEEYYVFWKDDLLSKISDMKSDIDDVLKNGIFDDE